MMLKEEILKLKQEKNAIILAHFYQEDDIQEIADFIGDSLALANQGRRVKNKIIVFCGVYFMAETAKILNPEKKILVPDIDTGCSLADSCPKDQFLNFKKNYPNHYVVSYINCTAEIKELSDLICTSGNALQLINALPKELEIIFLPDKNLGSYINQQTGRNMILWDGTCHVHNQLKVQSIMNLKVQHPQATVIAHPECAGPVLALAEFIGSTNAMLGFVKKDKAKEYIVATETGLLYKMKSENPGKIFYIVPVDETCACNNCIYMKNNTLQKVFNCLKNEKPEILMKQTLIAKARQPLEKMLEISKSLNII